MSKITFMKPTEKELADPRFSAAAKAHAKKHHFDVAWVQQCIDAETAYRQKGIQ